MADALSDIVTLAGAFGSFTQSLATLHDTKVRVEKGLRAAQIERANNDFLQRFNLQYGDPSRLDSTNWQDALVDHESKLEEFLVQTRGGKAVDAEVRAELMPITEGFTTAVGNKMIEAYKTETQAAFVASLDEMFAARIPASEIRTRIKADLEMGILDPTKRRAVEVSLQKLEGSEYASRLMSMQVESEDGTLTRSTTPDEARANLMSISGLTETQKAAALSDIKAWQDGNSEELASRTKRFDKARTGGNLSPSAILDMGMALKDSRGMVNDAEYDEASMAYFAAMSQQSGITVERIANDLREMYGDEIPRGVAQEAIGVLNNMLADKDLGTSEERSTTIKNEIERISNFTIDGDKAADREMNRLKMEWARMYKLAAVGEATATAVVLVENEILNYGRNNGIDVSSWIKDRIDASKLPGAISAPAFDAMLKNRKYNWSIIGQSFDKDTQSDIQVLLSGSTKLTKNQIKLQTALTQAEKTMGNMLINSQMTNSEEIEDEYRKTAILLLRSEGNSVTGIQKGLFDGPFKDTLAGVAEEVDMGTYDRFYTLDSAGKRPTPAAISVTIEQVKQQYNSRLEVLAKDKIIPDPSSMRVITDGADEYLVASDGSVYAKDSIGGEFTIRKAVVRFDESEYKRNPKYMDQLMFDPPIKSKADMDKETKDAAEKKARQTAIHGPSDVEGLTKEVSDLKERIKNTSNERSKASLKRELATKEGSLAAAIAATTGDTK